MTKWEAALLLCIVIPLVLLWLKTISGLIRDIRGKPVEPVPGTIEERD
jgi:hypothetical protein